VSFWYPEDPNDPAYNPYEENPYYIPPGYVQPTVPTTPEPMEPTAPGGGGGGGGEIDGGGFEGYAPYTGPTRPQWNIPPVPKFTAPQFSYPEKFVPPKFEAPDPEGVLKDPGYQFRLKQGEGALEASAAARGTLRSGGTLKDILGYGQQLGSQEYGNIWNRATDSYDRNYRAAADEYMTNYGVARDVFDRIYSGSKDEYAPLLLEWSTRAGAEQRAGELEFNRLWDAYKFEQGGDLDWLTMLSEWAD
jgi:hypothetical protein